MLPPAPYNKAELTRYFYNIFLTCQSNKSADVLKFAIQIARRAFLETEQWRVVQDFLLSAYRQSPTVIPLMVDLIILRSLSAKDVSTDRVGQFIAARLPVLINAQIW
jgi:hypothetical protein